MQDSVALNNFRNVLHSMLVLKRPIVSVFHDTLIRTNHISPMHQRFAYGTCMGWKAFVSLHADALSENCVTSVVHF